VAAARGGWKLLEIFNSWDLHQMKPGFSESLPEKRTHAVFMSNRCPIAMVARLKRGVPFGNCCKFATVRTWSTRVKYYFTLNGYADPQTAAGGDWDLLG